MFATHSDRPSRRMGGEQKDVVHPLLQAQPSKEEFSDGYVRFLCRFVQAQPSHGMHFPSLTFLFLDSLLATYAPTTFILSFCGSSCVGARSTPFWAPTLLYLFSLSVHMTATGGGCRTRTPVPVPVHQTARFKLVGRLSGIQYAFPGPSTEHNDWTVPTDLFQVEEIVGRYLVMLEQDRTGQLVLARDDNGKVILSGGPVSAMLTLTQNKRLFGPVAPLIDSGGAVRVLFGDEKLTEEFEELEPTVNLAEVETPRSEFEC